ncbi:hypothetical protein BaRGS_00002557 [Batillaria attramentaria]|uniref:Uncharacterized protein n=1 Tax=Batillaria attramentaria TaxID=370345 RepID=A0ABD0M4M5_9CAEN
MLAQKTFQYSVKKNGWKESGNELKNKRRTKQTQHAKTPNTLANYLANLSSPLFSYPKTADCRYTHTYKMFSIQQNIQMFVVHHDARVHGLWFSLSFQTGQRTRYESTIAAAYCKGGYAPFPPCYCSGDRFTREDTGSPTRHPQAAFVVHVERRRPHKQGTARGKVAIKLQASVCRLHHVDGVIQFVSHQQNLLTAQNVKADIGRPEESYWWAVGGDGVWFGVLIKTTSRRCVGA